MAIFKGFIDEPSDGRKADNGKPVLPPNPRLNIRKWSAKDNRITVLSAIQQQIGPKLVYQLYWGPRWNDKFWNWEVCDKFSCPAARFCDQIPKGAYSISERPNEQKCLEYLDKWLQSEYVKNETSLYMFDCKG